MAGNTRLPFQGGWINSGPSSSSGPQDTESLILESIPSKHLSSPPSPFHLHHPTTSSCPSTPDFSRTAMRAHHITVPKLRTLSLSFFISEVKLSKVLPPSKAGEAAWLTFQNWSPSGSSRKSKQRPHLDPGKSEQLKCP